MARDITPKTDREIMVSIDTKLDILGSDMRDTRREIEKMATREFVEEKFNSVNTRLNDHIQEHRNMATAKTSDSFNSQILRFLSSKVGVGLVVTVMSLIIYGISIIFGGNSITTQDMEKLINVMENREAE